MARGQSGGGGWTRFEGAEEWLRKRDKVAQGHTAQSEREQFGAFLAQRVSRPVALSAQERDRLFQEFLNWTKARERR